MLLNYILIELFSSQIALEKVLKLKKLKMRCTMVDINVLFAGWQLRKFLGERFDCS